MDGLDEGAKLVVALLKLVFIIAQSHDARACLEPQLAIARDECSDDDSLIDISIKANETDASTIGATVVRLHLSNKLHGTNLGSTRESASREGIEESLNVVGTIIERSAHTADKVDDMGVELHVFVEVYLHIVAISTEIVAGKVDKHHMFGILLRVVAQELCSLAISLAVARPLGGTCNGVDESLLSIDAIVRLRTRAKDAETTKIEVEQIRRRIDTPEGTIEHEVVALIMLDEAPRDDYLEDVTPQAMLHTSADVSLMFLICERRRGLADRMEGIALRLWAIDGLLQGS